MNLNEFINEVISRDLVFKVYKDGHFYYMIISDAGDIEITRGGSNTLEKTLANVLENLINKDWGNID